MILFLCLFYSLCFGIILLLGDLRPVIEICLVVYGAIFILYLAVLRLLQKEISNKPQSEGRSVQTRSNTCLVIILATALCCRFLMLFSQPALSDDIYRYVWEGRITVSGINPYLHAPSSPELESFQDPEIYPNINNKDLPAIYPPLSQYIFALVAAVGGGLYAMKTVFTAFDLLTVFVLMKILFYLNMDLKKIAVYALNPLVIMEFAGSGHLDSAGIFFLVAAFYFAMRSRPLHAAFALALSILSKLMPLLFLPILFNRRIRSAGLVFVATIAAAYVFFMKEGQSLFHSFGVYAESWVFNASLYELFFMSFKDGFSARAVSGVLLLAWMVFSYCRYLRSRASSTSLFQLGISLLSALLLLSPVVHPWYICWMIPFMVVLPRASWIVFSGTVFISYWILKGYFLNGVWEENNFIKLAVYAPLFLLLVIETVNKVVNGR